MPQNVISVSRFSPETFVDLACRGSKERGEDIPTQVRYLAAYCERLGVRTLVHEEHYVDRHYVDEFAFYYSRMLSPPVNSVRRIHFFAREFTEDQLSQWIRESLESPEKRKEIEQLLSAGTEQPPRGEYLGYCSIRPIASAPIGRTLISPLPDSDGQRREIWATNKHFAHLANLRLRVDGLAFQQQDAAVGACATAALWSALVRVAKHEGMRAPTPAEISEAAIHNSRASGRSMLAPNTGLTIQQLCQATRAFGFTPETVSAFTRPEIVTAAVHTYLLSGIPVVILLRGSGIAHAVTAAGFQMSPSQHPSLQASVPVRSARMTKLYVHDDRLGPYARAFLEPFAHPAAGEGLIFETDFEGAAERWIVDTAFAPVYPKLRLPVQSLIQLAEHKAGLVELAVGAQLAPKLSVDFRYQRAGEYVARLAGRGADPETASTFVRTVALSRWCAVERWYLGEEEVFEFLYDTTDIVRDVRTQSRELLGGLVCLSQRFRRNAATIAATLGVPVG
jgi:hypothetical protein